MSNQNDLATAYETWDQRWTDEDLRQSWITPEPLVVDSLVFLKEQDGRIALDIGCGVGRHAIFLAQHGFNVTGVDLSQSGLDVARNAATQAGVAVELQIADFSTLPVADNSIDLVVAWNVIYHGDEDTARTALDEVRRVLRPGGLFLGTMISKRHNRYGDGTEIRPNTFVVDDDDEKAHAHFYCSDRELISLLDDFRLFHLQDRQQRESGTWHWEFLAEFAPGS